VSFNLLYWTAHVVGQSASWALFRPKITGRENIPRTGGFIMASNHISYYDPPLLGSWQWRELYFFAKKELFLNPIFGKIITICNTLPVSRGTIDRVAISRAVEAIQNGNGLIMFPEGTRSRTKELLKPKPGVGLVAIGAGCPIIPTYLHGANNLKDCLLRRDRLSISWGEPLSADWVKSFAPEKESYRTIAETVMERIAFLKQQVTGVKSANDLVEGN
jgi:1-acyl-sn-glycerol-3-phosphate acyltransferase